MISAQDENIQDCPFCGMSASHEIAGSDIVFAVRDLYPVTPLHTLVLPRRHVPTYFDLNSDEVLAVDELLRKLRADIAAADASVKGFNIGVNSGAAAGQTIFHCHIHLIPRRRGDVPDPWGGVRAIIPRKARYPASNGPRCARAAWPVLCPDSDPQPITGNYPTEPMGIPPRELPPRVTFTRSTEAGKVR